MEVFSSDPSRLEWKSEHGEVSVLGIFRPGTGFLKSASLSGKFPPADAEFEHLLGIVKDLSAETIGKSLFMAMKYTGPNRRSNEIVLFAEFLDGKLIAFCRPPWRKGQGL
jgi:hypothetical protein